jgi:hypothetical protein
LLFAKVIHVAMHAAITTPLIACARKSAKKAPRSGSSLASIPGAKPAVITAVNTEVNFAALSMNLHGASASGQQQSGLLALGATTLTLIALLLMFATLSIATPMAVFSLSLLMTASPNSARLNGTHADFCFNDAQSTQF